MGENSLLAFGADRRNLGSVFLKFWKVAIGGRAITSQLSKALFPSMNPSEVRSMQSVPPLPEGPLGFSNRTMPTLSCRYSYQNGQRLGYFQARFEMLSYLADAAELPLSARNLAVSC